jgi:hypothetical protein
MMSVPCGSIVRTDASASPKPVRTAKETVPALPAVPSVGRGAPCSFTYHSGYQQHTLKVGQVFEGRFRLMRITPSDPVHISLLDARGETSTREVCGLGSVSEWRYAA